MAQLKSAENMLQLEKEAEQTEIKGAGMQKTKPMLTAKTYACTMIQKPMVPKEERSLNCYN